MKFTVTARLWDGKEPTWWDWVKPVLAVIAVATAFVSLGVACFRSEQVVEGAAAVATAKRLGDVASAVSNAVNALIAFVSANKSPETLQHENYKTWIGVTPSEQSATWLANNYVVAVDPAEKQNVNADGKTITITHKLAKANGETATSDQKLAKAEESARMILEITDSVPA